MSFFNSLEKILLDTFTGKDNTTLDLGRVLWCAGVVMFFILSIHDIFHNNNHFDASSWGTGLGLVLAGGGAALGFKSGTEPSDKK